MRIVLSLCSTRKMMKLLALAALAVYLPATVLGECKDRDRRCSIYSRYCYVQTNGWDKWMKIYCQKTCPRHCSTGTGGGGSGSKGKCGTSSVSQGRIIAGVDAKAGAWPWMVSLNYRQRTSHFCGGSLIAPNWVLTASHCVDGQSASRIDVIIGEHNRFASEGTEQRINAKRIIMHAGYSKRNLANDIALIELERPARLSSRVGLVCLPPLRARPPIYSKCYLSGWGTMTHPGQAARVLQQAILPVVEPRNCFNRPEFICTGYGTRSKINACRGDSGGPLVCQQSNGQWVQHGIASFVVTYCKYYTAFAPVGDYRNWIKTNSGV